MTKIKKRIYIVLAIYFALSLLGLVVYLIISHQNNVKNGYNNDINVWLSSHITEQRSYRLDVIIDTTFAYGTESGQKPQSIADITDNYELTVLKDTKTAKITYVSQSLYYGSNNASNQTTSVDTSSYLSVSGDSVTIWLWNGSGYKKTVTENADLADAIDAILFSDNTEICDGNVLSAELSENVLSADKKTLTLKRSVDSRAWYLPYELIGNKKSNAYPPLNLEFTYAADTDGMRTCTVSDLKTLYAFAYAALHGTEYANIYTQNSLSYVQTLTIDFSDTGLAKSFSLPD